MDSVPEPQVLDDALLQRLHENDLSLGPELSICDLSSELCVRLAAALERNSCLEALTVQCACGPNRQLEVDVLPLLRCLRGNGSLSSLSLSDGILSRAAFDALAMAVRENATLAKLKISCSGDWAGCGPIFAEALEFNRALSSLELCADTLGNDVCKALTQMLRRGHNSTLTELSLCGEDLSDALVAQVATLLKDTSLLRSLELRSEAMGDESGRALADALRTNTTLRSLSLFGAFMTEESNRVIMEALQENVTLVSLKLDFDWDYDDAYYNDYDLGDITENALKDCLAINTTLTKLELDPPGLHWGPEITDAIARNTDLPEYWWTLLWIVARSSSPGVLAAVDAMGSMGFCCKIFSFFVPVGTSVVSGRHAWRTNTSD